ncbi:MAG: hypothetical protein Q8O74_00390, partial [bacterium]|nr:hypothetical protein [bacterium]
GNAVYATRGDHAMNSQSSGIIGLAAALLFSGAAHAVEADEVGNRVKDMFARQGVDMQWTGATGSGAIIVLDGVSIAAPGDPDRIQVGTVTFEDIEEEDDGDYLVGNFLDVLLDIHDQHPLVFVID